MAAPNSPLPVLPDNSRLVDGLQAITRAVNNLSIAFVNTYALIAGNNVFTGRNSFQSGLNVQVRVVTAAGAVTVTTSDYIVEINKTVGEPTTVNLPATPAKGDEYRIKDGKGDAATNNITLASSAGNIDGSATLVMGINYMSITVTYDGTKWIVT